MVAARTNIISACTFCQWVPVILALSDVCRQGVRVSFDTKRLPARSALISPAHTHTRPQTHTRTHARTRTIQWLVNGASVDSQITYSVCAYRPPPTSPLASQLDTRTHIRVSHRYKRHRGAPDMKMKSIRVSLIRRTVHCMCVCVCAARSSNFTRTEPARLQDTRSHT